MSAPPSPPPPPPPPPPRARVVVVVAAPPLGRGDERRARRAERRGARRVVRVVVVVGVVLAEERERRVELGVAAAAAAAAAVDDVRAQPRRERGRERRARARAAAAAARARARARGGRVVGATHEQRLRELPHHRHARQRLGERARRLGVGRGRHAVAVVAAAARVGELVERRTHARERRAVLAARALEREPSTADRATSVARARAARAAAVERGQIAEDRVEPAHEHERTRRDARWRLLAPPTSSRQSTTPAAAARAPAAPALRSSGTKSSPPLHPSRGACPRGASCAGTVTRCGPTTIAGSFSLSRPRQITSGSPWMALENGVRRRAQRANVQARVDPASRRARCGVGARLGAGAASRAALAACRSTRSMTRRDDASALSGAEAALAAERLVDTHCHPHQNTARTPPTTTTATRRRTTAAPRPRRRPAGAARADGDDGIAAPSAPAAASACAWRCSRSRRPSGPTVLAFCARARDARGPGSASTLGTRTR